MGASFPRRDHCGRACGSRSIRKVPGSGGVRAWTGAETAKPAQLAPPPASGYCARPLAHSAVSRGGMAEWFKAPVLKTGERKLRGFESYSLRQKIRLSGEVAEWLKAAAC